MDYLMGQNGFEEVEDMITLSNLTEDSLLTNLKQRYIKKLIYTYTGSILVAVNPYEILPIYTPDIVKQYFGKQRGSLPPHIFAIADAAYTNMMEERRNQSIIISGESGAGKTESTKLIIQYLAARTNKHSQVEQMIVESSPILEAFGNAKTVRNNNSSRFGKFIEIQFNTSGHICGARIQQYLLEKSRISSQSQSERNYHIFYQLLAGASEELKSKLSLTNADDYHYLNQSGCTYIDKINDVEDFEHVRYAMSVLGMPEDKQMQIFSILAAVLHLGNLQFEKNEKTQGAEGSNVSNRDTLKVIADLLLLDAAKLETCLTVRHVFIRGQNFVIPLKVNEAEDTRDSLAKSLYGNVFNWLVTFINSRIHKPQPNTTFIGVLDIFGFENFKKNSFEQFCINFANEKLQQHFNQHIFKLEQEEYEKEKINWSKIVYNDNQECLDLIEKRPLGILSLLDEECRFPQATDATLLEKLHSNHEKQKYYERPKRSKTTFIVKHYAGEVSYDTSGFLDKNKDTLSDDMLTFLQQCKNKFIVELFAPPKGEARVDEDDDSKGTLKKQVRTTAGTTFKTQLQQLVNTLSATAPHYVRCVKPNTTKEPQSFDDELVQAQLRYAGMMETIRIRKTGYPIRQTLKEFKDRYLLLEWRARSPDLQKTVSNLINLVNISYEKIEKDEWQVGLTKVFIRDPQYRLLEEYRKEKLVKKVVLIQATWRMYRLKKKYQAMRALAVVLQTSIRSTNARKQIKKTISAATTVQATWKMAKARRQFLQTRSNIRVVQNGVRALLARKKLAAEIKIKRDRIKRLEEIQREKDSAERVKMERLERERQQKEDAARADEEAKKKEQERLKKIEEDRARQAEEEAKKAEEKKAQLKELKQFDEISSLESKLRQQQQSNINELDNIVFSIEEFSFEGGVDDTQPYIYNPKMYEMNEDALDKISLTDLLQGLKQTIKSVTKFDVDDSKFELPAGIENVLKRLPQPIKKTASSTQLIPDDIPPPPPMMDMGSTGSYNTFLPPPPPPPSFMGNDPFFPPPPPISSLPSFDPMLGIPPPPPPPLEMGGAASSASNAASTSVQQPSSTSSTASSVQQPILPSTNNGKVLKPLVLDEEISLYSFYEYARKNFAQSKQKEDLYSYQKSYIKNPLLPVAGNDSDLAKTAVEIFSKIQTYLQLNVGSGGKKEEALFASVKYILSKGLAMESLRDEIYCQLIKQSTNTTTLELRLKAWELIHYVCATFAPSRKLIKYVASYIKQTANTEATKSIKDTALASYTTMQRVQMNGARKMVPSLNELESLRENRPIFVRVSFADGSLKGLTIDSATTCAEAVEDLCHRARLRPAKDNGFALIESFNGIERDLANDEKLIDVLSKLESLQSTKMTINFKLLLKKRTYSEISCNDEAIPSTERELVLHQIYNELLNGGFIQDTEFLLTLGATRLQADSGDYSDDIKTWLPGNGRGKYFTAQIEKSKFEEFIGKYRNLKSTSQDDAKRRLVDMVFGHPLAGFSLFQCEHDTSQAPVPKSFILGLNMNGVHLFDPANLKSVTVIKYLNLPVNSIKVTQKSITIPLENKVNLEIQHGEPTVIQTLIKDYALLLKNNAKFARALKDYNVNDPTLLPFKRNDIITIVTKDQENKWYIGTLNGREGSFPVDHVEILLTDSVSVPLPPPPPMFSPSTLTLSGGDIPPPPPPISLGVPPPSQLVRSNEDVPPPPPPAFTPPPPPMMDTKPVKSTPPPVIASKRASVTIQPPMMLSTPPPPPKLSMSGELLGPPPPPPPMEEEEMGVPPPPPVFTQPPPPMLSTPPPIPSKRSSVTLPQTPPPPPVSTTPPPPPPPMLSTPVPTLSPTPSRASISTPVVANVPAPAVAAGGDGVSTTPTALSPEVSAADSSKRMTRIVSMAPVTESISVLEFNLNNWVNHRLRGYKRFNATPANATLKKKPIDPSAYMSFTKDPIKESMIELETSKLSKRAVQIFQDVMMFMGEYPIGKSTNAALVACEVIVAGIQVPELRDEIYCQVYRQTVRNPKAESVRRGFELLFFVACSFPPSESLLSPFVEQMMSRNIQIQSNNPQLATIIQMTIERLEAHPLSPSQIRKNGPSTKEINSLRNIVTGDEIPSINIRSVMQTSIAVRIETYSNVREISTNALHQFGITPNAAKNFGLYQVNEAAGICRPLGDSEILYDILQQWEAWSVADSRINLDSFYLQLRRKYYVEDINKILDQEHIWTADEMAFDLTFAQLREEWLRGVYPVSEKECSNAAAILVQLAHPNQSKINISTKEAMRQFIPEQLMQSQSIKHWTSSIESLLFELVSQTPEYLKLLFIQILGKCPLFGCTLFGVTQKEKAILGICKKGVYLFDANTRETKQFWTFQSISNWSFTDNSFVIMTGSLMKTVKNTFTTTDYSAISSCYQFYSS